MSSKKDTTVRSKGEKIKKKYTARKNKDRYYSTENAFTVLKIGKLLNTIIIQSIPGAKSFNHFQKRN